MNYKLVIEHLRYNAESGQLVWKDSASRNRGKVAGTLNKDGYVQILFKGESFKAHRIVWFLNVGTISDLEIDHINGNRSDNRIENLRLVTPKQNQMNRLEHRNGLPFGTSKVQGGKYYQAKLHGKYLGNFKTREAAANMAAKYYLRGIN